MNLNTFRPRYFIRRVGQILYQRKHPDAPWLTPAAVLLLSEWLKPGDAGLEWGSGRSTLWFAKRVKRLTSIEQDSAWFERVGMLLRDQGLQAKVDYRYIECTLKEFDEPEAHPYADVAQEFEDGSLDFALVDGGIRFPCMRQVLPKLKPGGLLVLDNANRYVPNLVDGKHTTVHEPRSQTLSSKWKVLLEELGSWRAIHTSDGIWDTRFWVKPAP